MAERSKTRGFFITFEGGEGTGKTSQIDRLRKKLEKSGRKITVTREPGGTAGAEAVRHVLLSGAAESLGPQMEAMLFAAARADHVNALIRPALQSGDIVISDRFIDSTRVYQGGADKVDMEFLKDLEAISCEDAMPDLTLILDLAPETGMKRANARRPKGVAADRFEKETLSRHKKRRAAYRKIAKAEPERCILIDASGSEAQVAKRIWAVVEQRLKPNFGKNCNDRPA